MDKSTEPGNVTISIKVPAQFRGSFVFKAYDNAGNYKDYSDKVTNAVDTVPPKDLGISYSDEYQTEDNKGYYNADKGLTVTFTATDVTAGVDYFEITAIAVGGADATDIELPEGLKIDSTGSIIENPESKASFVEQANITLDKSTEPGNVTISIKVPAQFRGYFKFTATDKSGNTSDEYFDETKRINAVDTKAPIGLGITYSETYDIWQKVLSYIKYGFYNTEEKLTATFTATDVTAGVDYFEIIAKADGVAGATTVELPDGLKIDANGDITGGTAGFVNQEDIKVVEAAEPGKVTISFSVPAQFRGSFEFKVYDKSGNSSEYSDDIVSAADTKAPEVSVEYIADNGVNVAYDVETDDFKNAAQAYYDGKVTAKITVTEANFFEGDSIQVTENNKNVTKAAHNVGILLTKTDNAGKVTKIEYLPEGADKLFADADESKTVSWITDTETGTVHTFEIVYDDDADYVLTVIYADFSGNRAVIKSDDRAHAATYKYTSKVTAVDTVNPTIDVEYTNKDVKNEITGRKYYDKVQSAVITVTEHNFRASDVSVLVESLDVTGNIISNTDFEAYAKDLTNWTYYNAESERVSSDSEDIAYQKITLAYDVEANYTFDIAFEDMSNRAAADYEKDSFTVDTTAPSNLTVSYRINIFESIINSITFGYYNSQMTVTVTAEDNVSGIHLFKYSYINGDGVSPVNAELLDQVITSQNIKVNGNKFTAEFNIPREALQSNNQFNGSVGFTASDCSVNDTDYADKNNAIVVDNIAPNIQVSFNEPVQTVGKVSYYDGNINATIVINEANFFSEDVVVTVNKDGDSYPVQITWNDESADIHTGTFTLSEDGDYTVNAEYTDRSENKMTSYKSEQMTIDTKVPVINVTGIQHQSANNGETVSFTVTVTDTNIGLNGFKPELSVIVRKTNADNKYEFETININLGEAKTAVNANGETVYEYTVENLELDGFYTFKCSAVDYANHNVAAIQTENNSGENAVEAVEYSVNRGGSVFWFETIHNDKYTGETYENSLQGAYANDQITVKLHEINVDEIDVSEDSEKSTVLTLNDGSSAEVITLVEMAGGMGNYEKNVQRGTGGWYECIYTLNNDNFDNDGSYSIGIITYDRADNSNINTKTEEGTISFTVDRTKPVVSINVTDGQSINAAEFTVEFNITEINPDEQTLIVKLNGKEITPTSLGNNQYSFVVGDGLNQSIEIVTCDLAGNESEIYKVDEFTVSTNIFVLWYANTPLFWGTIAAVVLAAGGIVLLVILKKRKKEE
ncbi:MAG: hypothetical protein IJZ90_04000 [Clostridia bacterium]|nr:hypothetical protein [Clostridia bacterium]